jgi:hypothetical protein
MTAIQITSWLTAKQTIHQLASSVLREGFVLFFVRDLS